MNYSPNGSKSPLVVGARLTISGPHNPKFASGDLSGWSDRGMTPAAVISGDPDAAHSGVQSLMIPAQTAGEGRVNITDRVAVLPGERAHVVQYLLWNGQSNSYLGIMWLAGDGALICGQLYPVAPDGG